MFLVGNCVKVKVKIRFLDLPNLKCGRFVRDKGVFNFFVNTDISGPFKRLNEECLFTMRTRTFTTAKFDAMGLVQKL